MTPEEVKALCSRLFGVKKGRAGRVVAINWEGYCLDLSLARSNTGAVVLSVLERFQSEVQTIGADYLNALRGVESLRQRQTELTESLAEKYKLLNEARELLVKANSDLQDANHKALNYKSQRDQALRDNARLRGLLTLLADNIKASANTCGALEAMAHDLPDNAPEKEGG